MQEALFYCFSLERHVPGDHMLRRIDGFVDLSEVRAHLAPYYSDVGRRVEAQREAPGLRDRHDSFIDEADGRDQPVDLKPQAREVPIAGRMRTGLLKTLCNSPRKRNFAPGD